jgi:glycosyltransferase involved in cell wall biosynthesis
MIKRIYYYIFSVFVWILLCKLWVISLFYTKKERKFNSIAILPYYPKDWPGGNRTTSFKSYFEIDHIKCDIFEAWTKEELEASLDSPPICKIYNLYYKILFRRIKTIIKLNKYSVIWVQRSIIPVFPFKHAYFEKLALKFNKNIIYDFYDADYESNYNLVFETVKSAKKVTVASIFLKEKFTPVNAHTHFVRFSIDTEKYIKKQANLSDKIIIGWMGSPENAKQLLLIAEQLQRIEKEYSNVIFSFVCREMPDLGLKRSEIFNWDIEGFNYYKWLAHLDIGLVPFIEQTDRTKAKISMKGLEFMYVGIPMIISEWVHSDKLLHNESCLIAKENEWYNSLKELISNKELANKLSRNSQEVYENYHEYEVVYKELKNILLN